MSRFYAYLIAALILAPAAEADEANRPGTQPPPPATFLRCDYDRGMQIFYDRTGKWILRKDARGNISHLVSPYSHCDFSYRFGGPVKVQTSSLYDNESTTYVMKWKDSEGNKWTGKATFTELPGARAKLNCREGHVAELDLNFRNCVEVEGLE